MLRYDAILPDTLEGSAKKVALSTFLFQGHIMLINLEIDLLVLLFTFLLFRFVL